MLDQQVIQIYTLKLRIVWTYISWYYKSSWPENVRPMIKYQVILFLRRVWHGLLGVTRQKLRKHSRPLYKLPNCHDYDAWTIPDSDLNSSKKYYSKLAEPDASSYIYYNSNLWYYLKIKSRKSSFDDCERRVQFIDFG